MRPRRIVLSPGFEVALRALTEAERQSVKEAITKFKDRSGANALRVEYKAGLKIWAFRVSDGVRVFYVQKKDDKGQYSELFHVGHHDDYRTVKRKRPR